MSEQEGKETTQDGPQLPMTALYMYHREFEGPVTVCLLVDASGAVVARGVAVCSVDKVSQLSYKIILRRGDQFNKATGRMIAFGRALKAAQARKNGNPISSSKHNANLLALQTGRDAGPYSDLLSLDGEDLFRPYRPSVGDGSDDGGEDDGDEFNWDEFNWLSRANPVLNQFEARVVGSFLKRRV